jgi:hypothetical protein
MPYAERNDDGQIVALHIAPVGNSPERVAADDPDVFRFLLEQSEQTELPSELLLSLTDYEIVRVVEDLISILIDKGHVMFTDLPPAAQRKLARRQQARNERRTELSLIADADGIV